MEKILNPEYIKKVQKEIIEEDLLINFENKIKEEKKNVSKLKKKLIELNKTEIEINLKIRKIHNLIKKGNLRENENVLKNSEILKLKEKKEILTKINLIQKFSKNDKINFLENPVFLLEKFSELNDVFVNNIILKKFSENFLKKNLVNTYQLVKKRIFYMKKVKGEINDILVILNDIL